MTTDLTTQLEFNVDFTPSQITINNEAKLKELVDATIARYGTLVFTDDNIPEAKQAKADLNKVARLLDDQRKAVKKEYSKPLKEFETKINGYTNQIKLVSEGINESISTFEESEKAKRLDKLVSTIEEISPNYGIDSSELTINPSWLNKGNFTTKGELNKKTLEEVTFQMKQIADANKRIENDKAIIGNYAKAVGLEPESWVAQIENGLFASDLMKQIDATVVAKREREEREIKEQQAQAEYEQAMKELKERQIDNNVIDQETGEILEDSPNIQHQEIEEFEIVELRLTGTHEQLTALNKFITGEGIKVEVM
ncbi:DUF1351 domain-containing protein [Enterococcus entomosocium]|uniref:DUF1351 domain-containing protein n=1 Tax=Enterococcus entomosocium TaxID=3034352 RepID=UPI0018834CF2|nr:DUF1351 domain-containing protein [Enterococcus entomosocium]MBF0015301.1 DUF1351 domain-containing protein [Enterococcus casseliflavus]